MAKEKQVSNGAKKAEPSKNQNENGVAHASVASSSDSSLSSRAVLGCLAIAVLSFIAGVFTPRELFAAKARDIQQRLLQSAGVQIDADPCSKEALSQFIHDEPVQGLHIVCLKNKRISLYPEAVVPDEPQQVQLESNSWRELKQKLTLALELYEKENKQSWAIFSSIGERIAGGDDDEEEPDMDKLQGLLLVFVGGQWLWPGVRIGFRRTIDLSYIPDLPKKRTAEKRNATLETLSLYPLVLSVEGFLSDDECDLIQELAEPTMEYSGVVLMDKDEGRPASDFRTSQNTFVGSRHPTMKSIDYRTAGLVRIPRSHQEDVQVLRYGEQEYYTGHNDYFDKRHYKNDPDTLEMIDYGRRNRMATVFWYLTDVAEGGETVFPRFNGAPTPKNFEDCSVGLKVKPQRGKVIIFYSMRADGELDPLSLHGACPVKDGVKWAANKWVWNAPI